SALFQLPDGPSTVSNRDHFLQADLPVLIRLAPRWTVGVELTASWWAGENLTEILECGFLKLCHFLTPSHGWRALTRRWSGRRNTSIPSMPRLVCSSKAPSGISF